MISICLHTPVNEELQNQWDYVLNNFMVDQIYVVGGNIKSKIFKNATYINDYSEIKSKNIVLCSPDNAREVQGEISLIEFSHPDDCCYVFGRDDGYFKSNDFQNIDLHKKVYIPMSNDLDMYSHVAAAVFLFDRKVKNG